MIKVFVDKLPKKAEECPFAAVPVPLNDMPNLIPNCWIKNKRMAEAEVYGFVPDKFTCSLSVNEECPCLCEFVIQSEIVTSEM